MNWTPYEIEQAWGLSGLVLTNGLATAVDEGDLNLINNRIRRSIKSGTLNVPRLPTVTRRQIRLWLFEEGKLDLVLSALNSIQEPAKTKALIEWDGNTFDRDNQTVIHIGQILGMTFEEMDEAWLKCLEM
jgi:hypothetical protein